MSQKSNTATLDMFEALLQHVGYRGELKRSEFGGYECTHANAMWVGFSLGYGLTKIEEERHES